MKRLILAAALALGVRSNAAAQFCPTCIQNTAAPQNAQMNITSATIRGTLTVGSLQISTIGASTVTATALIGGGAGLTGLNASQLASGTVPAARLSGAYPGITAIGPVASGVWNGSIVGSQYGGTGANLITSSTGSVPYFSSVGTMSALAPATAGFVLQTNGPASAPSWTGAPQVQGTNITAIPLANLIPGELPTAISVNDASISTVSAAKVIGSIPGNAANINGTLAVGQLGAGTLNTSNPASSVTASGVTAGIYGGQQRLLQATVAYDGRITAISQSSFTVYAASVSAGALPSGVTIGASQVTAGALGASVRASSIAASGVAAGSYGSASQAITAVIGVDGRVTGASQSPIAINTNQINNGTLTAGVVVPAVNIQAGQLAGSVIASSVAASGVTPGTYGNGTNSVQITLGTDGRVTSVSQFPIPNASTDGFAVTSVDNNWAHSQTFQASVTINSSLMASFISGNGTGITNIPAPNIVDGVMAPGVVASSVSIPFLSVPSSVTASTYFGDGSNLTGLVFSTTVLAGYVARAGDTMTGPLTIAGSSLTVLGDILVSSNGSLTLSGSGSINLNNGSTLVAQSSVTASSFFGDGSGLTGVDTGPCGAGSGGPESVLCQGFSNVSSSPDSVVGGGSFNSATAPEATVGGGGNNSATAQSATIPGGHLNEANAPYAFAAGQRAKANNVGAFVWADSTAADFASTLNDSFIVRAQNGVAINKATPTAALDVEGAIVSNSSVTASSFFGDGGGITGIVLTGAAGGDLAGTYPNPTVLLSTIGAPTYTSVQNLMNFALSPGVSSGGDIFDAGGGAVNVAAGTGFIKATDSSVATLSFFNWSSSNGIVVANNSTRYIGVIYNGGVPIVSTRATETWDLDTEFPLGRVINEAGIVYIATYPWVAADNNANIIEKFDSVALIGRDNRVGGLTLSNCGTRNVCVTAGQLLARMSEFPLSAIDTSVSGSSFTAYYRDGSSGFTIQASSTQWNNTQYDDGTGTLAAMTALNYSSRWFYRMTDGSIAMMYGQSESASLSIILAEGTPSAVPDRISNMGLLIGRFIIQTNAATPDVTQSAFGTPFTAAQVTSHFNLSDIGVNTHAQIDSAIADIAASTTALSVSPVATSRIDLSTVSAALGTKLSSGAVPSNFVDLSTVTAALVLKVDKAGDTMTGALTMASGSSITLSGSGGYIAGASSITASAFFGSGYQLTGISVSSYTQVPQTSFTNTSFGIAIATVTMTTRGGQVEVSFTAPLSNDTSNIDMASSILIDGAPPTEFDGTLRALSAGVAAQSGDLTNANFTFVASGLAAGQHSFALMLKTSNNTGTVRNAASVAYAQFGAREIQ